jgi:hypothetical protein
MKVHFTAFVLNHIAKQSEMEVAKEGAPISMNKLSIKNSFGSVKIVIYCDIIV